MPLALPPILLRTSAAPHLPFQLPSSLLLLNTHQPPKSHQYFLACLVMPLELCEPMSMKYWLLPIQSSFVSCNIQGYMYFHNKRSDIDRALFICFSCLYSFPVPFQFLSSSFSSLPVPPQFPCSTSPVRVICSTIFAAKSPIAPPLCVTSSPLVFRSTSSAAKLPIPQLR